MSASLTYKSIECLRGIVTTTVQRFSSLHVERVLTQPRPEADDQRYDIDGASRHSKIGLAH